MGNQSPKEMQKNIQIIRTQLSKINHKITLASSGVVQSNASGFDIAVSVLKKLLTKQIKVKNTFKKFLEQDLR